MDTALILRKSYEKNIKLSKKEIEKLLNDSNLIQKLTSDYDKNAFFNIFRIMCLSEIPYIEKLSYTQKVINFISENLATPEGFSYTGSIDYIVPCYNAMLMEAFVRLGLSDSKEVQNALNWIKKYQVFDRNQITLWNKIGIKKHGGCMNSIPCYIGIGKTVRSLITYSEYTNHIDKEVEEIIEKGLEYMLNHNMFQRLSNNLPISSHITDIIFPQSYMLSLTDLVYIVNKRKLWDDPRTNELKKLLKSKEYKLNEWKIDYIYSNKGYKTFESKRNSSEWIEYLFNNKQ